MTELDGEEPNLIERLKEEPRTRDIPVVGLADGAPSDAHESGARYAALFARSCPPDQLAVKLREVLAPASSHARSR